MSARAPVLLIKAGNLTLPGSSMVPPLGLMYLASVLRDQGHPVRLLDTRLSSDWGADVDAASDGAGWVGVSALTVERASMKAIARRIKARRPGLTVVAGGPHATAFPADCLGEPAIDAVVVGEGESVIGDLARAGRDPVPDLPGVYTRDRPAGGDPAPARAPDVESLPFPAWDLVRAPDYFPHRSMSGMGGWSYSLLVTSRGCPYRCCYCHRIHGKRFRPRSAASVAGELDVLGRVIGRGVVEVLDDVFNLQKDRAMAILDAFRATGGRLVPAFPNGMRADLADGDLLDGIAAAGCPHLAFAIETGSSRLQRQIGKRLDLDRAREAIAGASRRGLYTNGFFMLGFPGETRAEMLETVAYARSAPFVTAQFFKVIPFPGTDLWAGLGERADQYRDLLDVDYFSSSINLSAASDADVAAIFRLAYLSFYGRPRQVWRILRRHPARSQLLARASQTLALIVRNRALWNDR